MTKVVVIGAGMGGLTTALALLQQGIEVEVHEQASALREVGAGLTLSRSSMRGLHSLGLFDAVRRVSQISAAMPFVHYRTGRLLWGSFASDEPAVEPADDPFISRHIFRADLQQVLSRALMQRSPASLRLGHALVSWSQDGDGVDARFADGSLTKADVLIGADGLHSRVRSTHWSASPPAYTGQVAWRFLLDGERARSHMSTGPATVFFGPDRILNRYLLRGGALLNCVAIVRTPGWHEEGWSTRGDPAELATLFEDWHPDVRALIELARGSELFKWALGVHAPLPTWLAGRVALLGDAAHPMLPFLGMGAAMAIEDAIVLGRAMGAHADPLAALAAYESTRKARATSIADASRRQGEALQAEDPDRFEGLETPLADRALFDYDPSTTPIEVAP